MSKTFLITLAVIVAIVCLVLAGVYWTHPADQLPHWLPGYSATDSATHVKHGLAAVIVAIGAGIFAWFQTGPKTGSPTPPSAQQ
jgi:amino acid transporter